MALDFSEFPSPFRLGENLAQPPYSVTPVTPADGDDMTWDEDTLSRDTAIASELALAKVWADGDNYDNAPLTYAALVVTVYRLQDEVYALAAQVVELREKVQAWEGDS